MSLQDLGNIGEFVAAVGVVVSLVYLAVQIRQNTRQINENTESLRITSRDEALRTFSHYREHIIRHPEIADLYLRGGRNLRDLDAVDRLRFSLLASELLFTFQGAYLRAKGFGEPELWEYLLGTLPPILRQPGIREWWSEAKGEFVAEFAAEIEKHLPNG